MSTESRLTAIEQNIRDLKDWAASHDEEHTADTRLLSSIVDSLSTHEGNHHGRTSQIRLGGLFTAIMAALVALAELARYFLLA